MPTQERLCGRNRQFPVGYLEGIFIEDAYRKHGYAKELLKACEAWAKEKHCAEFASDCELENDGQSALSYGDGV